MAVTAPLSDSQRLQWLRLIRTENVGPVTFHQLIERFGNAEAALDALPELMRKGGARHSPKICSVADAEREWEVAERFGARFVGVCEPDYPPMLARMEMPPPILAIKGRSDISSQPALSIVGARNASLSGIKFASRLARDFGSEGYSIASGMARGIDAAAHSGAMETGTIAVLAGGLDEPYPPENNELYRQICEKGLALSEKPFGWQPRARDFPRRNRLVAGLGLGLVVVEAARRSGSLISARLANEMGRSVFAVPGSPLDPRAEGCNDLIRQGATLVTSARDVMEQIAPQTASGLVEDIDPLPSPEDDDALAVPAGNDARRLVMEALGPTPLAVDELIHHTGLPPAQISSIMLELDLAGRLERHSGGYVSLLAAQG